MYRDRHSKLFRRRKKFNKDIQFKKERKLTSTTDNYWRDYSQSFDLTLSMKSIILAPSGVRGPIISNAFLK